MSDNPDLGIPRVYFKNGAYRLSCNPRFKKLLGKSWYTLGKNPKDAVEEYNRIEAMLTDKGSMGQLFDRYEQEVIPHKKAERTRQSNLCELKRLRMVFDEMDIEDLKTQHVYRYMELRGKQSPTQANHELSLLKHVIKYGQRWGVCELNPAEPVQKIQLKPRDRYVTDRELSLFSEAAGVWCELVAKLAYLTGLRLSDVLSLRLDQITERGIILRASKTGKQAIIQLAPSLNRVIEQIQLLNRATGKQGETLVCTNRGTAYSPDSFHSRWQAGMKKAVVAGVERFHFHDLRAKHATDLDAQGGSAMDNLQHSDQRTTNAYLRAKKITVITPLELKAVS